ncbi:hypothetical protein [Streptococcus danieliae]|uniref:hypothetical protein n=1 Tax=Streptococcus danieliae TaxID=747656 RepID=UPI0021C81006|nr:hypothetical protein [Streptococcus danieliae]MCU0082691.1 hypothetical protein [Streptococcus danieliae]
MNYLTLPFFKALIQKKEARIILAFSLFPLILLPVSLFDTNFMQLTASGGGISFVEFFSAVLVTQNGLFLPTLVFIYLAIQLFREEINQGILYLYKDRQRKTILNAKLGSLILLQLVYMGLTFISSLITYYFHLTQQGVASGDFLTPVLPDLQEAILNSLGVGGMLFLSILLASALSIRLSSGFTMLMSTLFSLLSYIAPLLNRLRYLFPNGYVTLLDDLSFISCLLLTLLVTLLYASLFYSSSLHFYKRTEY